MSNIEDKKRREFIRYSCDNVPVVVNINGNEHLTRLDNISKYGVGFDFIEGVNENDKIQIRIKYEGVASKGFVDCLVKSLPKKKNALSGLLEVDKDGIVGGSIQSGIDVALLADIKDKQEGREKTSYAFAISDRIEVNQQTRDIQGCRSNIFIATLGAVGGTFVPTFFVVFRLLMSSSMLLADTTQFAVLVSVFPFTKLVTNWAAEQMYWGVVTGCLLAGGLLFVGILATIEKARAINVRKGFLIALNTYLSKGKSPKEYPGWTYFLEMASNECGMLQSCNKCSRMKSQNSEPIESCWDIGLKRAINDGKGLVEHKRQAPGTTSSFMALSLKVYIAIYILTCLLLLYASCQVAMIANGKIDMGQMIMVVLTAFIVGSGIPKLCLHLIKNKTDSGLIKPSVNADTKIVLIIIGVVVAYITIDWCSELKSGAISYGVTILSVILGYNLFYFSHKMRLCSKGKHSIEANSYGWSEVLVHCRKGAKEFEHVELRNQTGGGV